MTGFRFAEVQARPAEFLNLTSLTLEEFEVLVAPFEAAFQGRRGASMGNREPLHRLSDLPAGNAGRSAVLPAHLPEDLRRSSGPGAAVRHEPEQSQPVVLLPALLAARRGLGDAPARSLAALAHKLAVSEGPLVVAPPEEPAPSPASAPVAGQGSPLLLMTGRNDALSAPRTLLNRRNVTVARKRTIR